MKEPTIRSGTELLHEQAAKRVTRLVGEEPDEAPLVTALVLGIAAVGALLDIADAIRELKNSAREGGS